MTRDEQTADVFVTNKPKRGRPSRTEAIGKLLLELVCGLQTGKTGIRKRGKVITLYKKKRGGKK